MRSMMVAAAGMVLSGCAVLSAPAPLFAVSDQDRVFALEEGLWAHRGSDCAADPARSSPRRKSCLDWAMIRHHRNGDWIAEPATSEDADDAPVQFLVMPATAAAGEGLRAPVYVAEGWTEKDKGVNYAALIPRGGGVEGPVRRLVLVAIDCNAVLRDGEIADITVERKDGRISNCVATSKDAVREAARRAVVAEAPRIGEEELVWVRK